MNVLAREAFSIRQRLVVREIINVLSTVVNSSEKELVVDRIFWPNAEVERLKNILNVAFFDRVATARSSVSETIS